jgi:PIN domain nuclease of toxin-antitoxin system
VKLLLDTHALIWFIGGDDRFSEKARTALQAQESGVLLSVASIWEMAIKMSLGKLRMRLGLEGELRGFLEENGFELLPIEYAHAAQVALLPFKHRDPFDRLLVAQALIENLTIVSHDAMLDGYGVKRLW